MKTFILFTATTLLTIKGVFGHGYVESAVVNGNFFQGFGEADKPDNTALLVTDYGMPNYDVWSPIITCGTNPKAATNIADAPAGSPYSWKWVTHTWVNGGQTWTHMEGTLRTFIGQCIGGCGSTDPSQVQWAEVTDSRHGYDSGSRQWAAGVLHDGGQFTDYIPHVPNGDYLLRTELTALHYSDQLVVNMDDSVGHGYGTEFYAGCMAIRVRDSDGSWNPNTVMKFPGAYNVNEQYHYNPGFFQSDWTQFGWAATEGAYTINGGVGGGQPSTSGGNKPPSTNSNGNTNSNTSSNPNPATNPSVPNPMCKARRKRSTGSSEQAIRRRKQHARAGKAHL